MEVKKILFEISIHPGKGLCIGTLHLTLVATYISFMIAITQTLQYNLLFSSRQDVTCIVMDYQHKCTCTVQC